SPARPGLAAAWLEALAMMNLLACRRDDPPRAAELVHALAGGLAGFAVGYEVVERVTAVGDLELAVLALGCAEQRGAHAWSGGGLARGGQWRPQGCTGPVTDARRALVLDEVVERDALA